MAVRLVGGKVVAVTIPVAELDRLPTAPETRRPIGSDHVTVIYSAEDADSAGERVAHLIQGGVTVVDLEVTSPSLDDVFTQLTPTGARS